MSSFFVMLKDKRFLRSLFTIALPIAAQNFLSFAVNMADTVMLGQTENSQTVLSASSLANQPMFIFSMFVFGLASGATVLSAQYWGKRDTSTISVIFSLALKISLLVSAVVTVFVFFFPETVMRIYTNELPVIEAGVVYLRIMAFTYLLFGFSNTSLILLRGVECVRISVVVSFVSLLTNVFLNWVLIFGNLGFAPMGILGAAVATLIARVIEATIVLVYLLFIQKKISFKRQSLSISRRGLYKDFFRYSLPVIFNETMWSVGFSAQSIVLGHLGEEAVAASSVVSTVHQLATILIFGVANASGVMIGKYIGMNEKKTAYLAAKSFQVLSIAVGCSGFLILFLLKDIFPNFYNLPQQTKELASSLMIAAAIIVFFVSNAAINIVGILRGGGDTRFALVVDSFTLWIWSVPVGFLTAFVFEWPVFVVFFLMKSDEILKTIVLLPRVMSGKWIKTVTQQSNAHPLQETAG
ncbi:MAG: MATE family efflux transporter [Clostridia bacterium]|nr:MATE family efflux transporter [Clostridia bacterium]